MKCRNFWSVNWFRRYGRNKFRWKWILSLIAAWNLPNLLCDTFPGSGLKNLFFGSQIKTTLARYWHVPDISEMTEERYFCARLLPPTMIERVWVRWWNCMVFESVCMLIFKHISNPELVYYFIRYQTNCPVLIWLHTPQASYRMHVERYKVRKIRSQKWWIHSGFYNGILSNPYLRTT